MQASKLNQNKNKQTQQHKTIKRKEIHTGEAESKDFGLVRLQARREHKLGLDLVGLRRRIRHALALALSGNARFLRLVRVERRLQRCRVGRAPAAIDARLEHRGERTRCAAVGGGVRVVGDSRVLCDGDW